MRKQQTALQLPRGVSDRLRSSLPQASEAAVAAIVTEVPSYSRAFTGPMGATIQQAVTLALGGFLDDLSNGPSGEAAANPQAMSGAYDLGRGEARSGRSMDALLAAYRVGARVAWQSLSGSAVSAGLDAARVAVFADLVFAYIDQLSASSVAGHNDELETSGRVRSRLREKVARLLVSGASAESVGRAAERAEWPLPARITVVLLGQRGVRAFLTGLGTRGETTLMLVEDQPGVALEDQALLLVPEAARRSVRSAVGNRRAVIGPTVPLARVESAVQRTVRVQRIIEPGTPLDIEDHLGRLVLEADPDSLAELRERVLAPLAQVRPSTREKLAETLRMWLLLQGRRDQVAEALFVHPQTVRYRMGLVREHFGDLLDDPAAVRDLVIALA